MLRVTAPVMFGHRYVLPILRDFLDAYPGVSSITLFVDRVPTVYSDVQWYIRVHQGINCRRVAVNPVAAGLASQEQC